jgi:hypothetical protein
VVQLNPVLVDPHPLLFPEHHVVLAPLLLGWPAAGATEMSTLSIVGWVPPSQWTSPWITAVAADADGVAVSTALMPDVAYAGAGIASTTAATADMNVSARLM